MNIYDVSLSFSKKFKSLEKRIELYAIMSKLCRGVINTQTLRKDQIVFPDTVHLQHIWNIETNNFPSSIPV